MAASTPAERGARVVLVMTRKADPVWRGLLFGNRRRFIGVTTQASLHCGLALVWFMALDAIRMAVRLLGLVAIDAIARWLGFRVALVTGQAIRVARGRPCRNRRVFLLVALRAGGAQNLEDVGLVATRAILVAARERARSLGRNLAFVTTSAEPWSLGTRPVHFVTCRAIRVALDRRLAMLSHDSLVAPLAIHTPTPVRRIRRVRVVAEPARVDVAVRGIGTDNSLAQQRALYVRRSRLTTVAFDAPGSWNRSFGRGGCFEIVA